MSLVIRRFAISLFAVAAIAIVGCGAKPDTTSKDSGHDDHSHGEHADGSNELDLSYLSAEDQEAARKQKFCPVGGPDALLGTPGMTAVKVTVEGREVFLCCEGCEADLREDPQHYFAILDGKSADGKSDADGEAAPNDKPASPEGDEDKS